MSPLSETQLKELLAFTIELAHKAGTLILEGSEAIAKASASDINEKKNSVDLVTEYDVKTEDLVRSEISKVYPDFGLCVLRLGGGVWLN